MLNNLLGGLSPRQFLEEYWQKKPLLVRQAIPGFTGLLDKEALFDLACDPDVESRHVRRDGGNWQIGYGPQKRSALRGRKTPWTVLVQGLNLWLPEGDALLRHFNFIPQARLDDLMVSYAVDGGGVGPHYDNYDVFLLQGFGKRRWRIGDQQDQELVEGLPLRILKHFKPTYDWVLEPGDMLYLPPHWAHDGIAVGECTTYSVGFRSLSAQEVASGFLGWLQENVCLEGYYSDPQLPLQENSAEISGAMLDQVAEMVARIRWQRDDIAAFLGCYLTEPKPHVFFDPPEESLSFTRFKTAVGRGGFVLDARSLLLFSGQRFFLNGEALAFEPQDAGLLAELAHQRRLDGKTAFSASLLGLLYQWYLDGFGYPGQG